MNVKPQALSPKPSRRRFLQSSAAAVGTAFASRPVLGFHPAGTDLLRVGLVGCGGRGTGAASQAFAAGQNVKMGAMAGAFGNRLNDRLQRPKGDQKGGRKVEDGPERRFLW